MKWMYTYGATTATTTTTPSPSNTHFSHGRLRIRRLLGFRIAPLNRRPLRGFGELPEIFLRAGSEPRRLGDHTVPVWASTNERIASIGIANPMFDALIEPELVATAVFMPMTSPF